MDPRRVEVIDDRSAAIMRGMTGAQRLAVASAMHESAVRMVGSYLRQQHPDWSDEQIARELRRRAGGET